MKIEKEAIAGSLQSNDCLVKIMPGNGLEIELKSSVIAQFGKRIREVVEETLKEFGVSDAKLVVEDKGALDCTIAARVETAVKRANE